MAVPVTTAAILAATNVASSYRVKLRRREFLELAALADPRVISHLGRMYFFPFDGLVA